MRFFSAFVALIAMAIDSIMKPIGNIIFYKRLGLIPFEKLYDQDIPETPNLFSKQVEQYLD